MSTPAKIEAVQKVTNALNDDSRIQPIEELEHVATREQFQSVLDSLNNTQSNFKQQIDGSFVSVEEIPEKDKNSALADPNVTAQKSGTATDQEQKQRQQQSSSEEVDTVDGVTSTETSISSPLIDEIGKINNKVTKLAQTNATELRSQAQEIITQIEGVKTQLSQTKDIRPSYQNLLRNHLTHIDDSLKIALSKVGVEYTPPPAISAKEGKTNPIERFIGYLTHSQHQLDNLDGMIKELGVDKNEISPVDMLALQIKVYHVQEQVEIFVTLLSKALESTKTIMNVQV